METRLHDPVPEALERGAASLRAGLAKLAEKGKLEDPDAAAALLETVPELEGLAGCDLVIEAAPELPDLKRDLFAAALRGSAARGSARHQHLVDPGDLARRARPSARRTWWACTSSTRRR